MNASPNRAALTQQEAKERAERMRRAVADVIDLDLPVTQVRRTRGGPEQALRDALKARGWVPPHFRGSGPRRRTFGEGKKDGTQLPGTRGDNQS